MQNSTKWTIASVADGIILPTASIMAITAPEFDVVLAAGVTGAMAVGTIISVTGAMAVGTIIKSIVINHLVSKIKRHDDINEQFIATLQHDLSLATQRAEIEKLTLVQQLRDANVALESSIKRGDHLQQALDDATTHNDEQQLQLVDVTEQNDKLQYSLNQALEQQAQLETQLDKVTSDSIGAITALSESNAQLKDTVHEIDLTCAYCNVKQPLIFNIAAGEFECKACHNVNAIHTNIFTARTNTLLR